MSVRNRYDGDLQMFVEDEREPDMRCLRFLRWLVEHRQLEHQIAGPSSGDLSVSHWDITPDLADAVPSTT